MEISVFLQRSSGNSNTDLLQQDFPQISQHKAVTILLQNIRKNAQVVLVQKQQTT